MKKATQGKRVRQRRKTPAHAKPTTHSTGAPIERVALPQVEVFTDSAESDEVQAATRDLRSVHDAQVADDDFQ